MKIKINGIENIIKDNLSIGQLLAEQLKDKEPNGIAVALNSAIVFKNNWGNTILKENDEIEIVHAVQGG